MASRYPRLAHVAAHRRTGLIAVSALMALALSAMYPLAIQPQDRGFVQNPAAAAKPVADGDYYALVIGIDHYPAPMHPLKTAVNDAKAIGQLLQSHYGFHVQYLLDRTATRSKILDAIVKYRTTLTENDSLLIYYAGHGYSDHDADKAYWLPVDADSGLSSNRIIADDLTSDLRALPSRHVLIISDSCYSGGLSRDANEPPPSPSTPTYLIRELHTKSRTLMSSGGDEPVADSGANGHSVFANAILKGLEQEEDPIFAAKDLFYSSIRKQVAGNSEQIPQYTVIRNSNDDNGDFVFARAGAHPVAARTNAAGGATRSAPSANEKAVAEPPVAEPAPSIPRPHPAESGNGTGDEYNAAILLIKSNRVSEAVPYFTRACNNGSAKACQRLGELFDNGRGVMKDELQATNMFRKACDAGYQVGCMTLGRAYLNGVGVAKDPSQTEALFRRGAALGRQACDRGDAEGCFDLGIYYSNGWGVPKDDVQAANFARKGCDGGEPRGCNNLGMAYTNGAGVIKDDAQATVFYRKACDAGEPTGCANLGRNLATGLGVGQDSFQATTLFRRACEGGAPLGCSYLGLAYHAGSGVPKDDGQAVTFSQRGCEGGDPMGCNNLGVGYEYGYGLQRNLQQAVALYHQACSAGYTLACQNLNRLQR